MEQISQPVNPLSAAVQTLKVVPLFSGLSDDELQLLEADLKPIRIPSGALIYEAGQSIQGLLILKAGVAGLHCAGGDLPYQVRRGELLGAELLAGQPVYLQTALAETSCELLFYPLSLFKAAQNRLPRLAETAKLLKESQLLASRQPLNWLQKGEAVQLMTRKHPLFLLLAALLPILAFGLLLLLTQFLPFIKASQQLFILITGFIFAALWIAWNLHNWANDYYIITNKRIIWMEHISGLFDSRQEAPLSALVSTGIESSQEGSLLGFADVILRTYIGDLRFRRVAHASAIAAIIEAYWAGSKEKHKDLDEEEIRDALRRKFGNPIQQVIPGETQEPLQASLLEEPEDGTDFNDWLFADFLKLRFEQGDTITYRKHWWVMLRSTFLPFIGIMLAFAVLAAASSFRIQFLNRQMLMFGAVFFLLAMLFWWFYAYTDWKNDVFELNPSQIIDIDRKPFGRESHRVAPLDSILSVHYKKSGFLPLLFNFGTVFISVGSQEFSFDDVADPAQVQQEIFARMGARQDETKSAEAEAEKERLAEWFRLYHEQITGQAEDSAQAPGQSPQKPPSGGNLPFG